VAETCEIALARVKWLQNKDLDDDNNPYFSVDPSPAAAYTKSVDELQTIMMDDNETLFTRYRALFSLRNLRTQESILAFMCRTEGKECTV
jgi:deoxyhypusine monooxygenase